MKLSVNGKQVDVAAAPDEPLLWVIREQLKLTGHEVRLRHRAVRRVHRARRRQAGALLPDAAVAGGGQERSRRSRACRPTARIRCRRRGSPSRCRSAGTASRARSCRRPRCSREEQKPTRAQIVQHMNGNLCRCGTYDRIVRAIQRAAKEV